MSCLVVDLRLTEGGPVAWSERVREADLADARAELWRDSHLRKGFPSAALDDVEAGAPRPLHDRDGRCVGFTLAANNPSGTHTQCVFGRACMELVAARGARALVSRGALKEEETYYYQLRVEQSENDAGPADDAHGVRAAGPIRRRPLAYKDVALAPLLERAESVGTAEDPAGLPYVFYLREAREAAERFSRRGGDENPPVETGAVLLGSLCACPSGEMFVVVTDAIEATDAEQQKFSLSFTSRTWSRIQTIVKARQAHDRTRADRIVGQAHGHNFLPLNGAEPCEACATIEVCGRSSAFLSADDIRWSRAVLAGESFQVGHVFGLDAMGRPRDAFYGQVGGTLARRGYHVIEREVFESEGGE
ncbi:MAG: hypothetical protein ACYTGZ_06840 [Planctomycetota bacterium]|jgi:hypothetical protein